MNIATMKQVLVALKAQAELLESAGLPSDSNVWSSLDTAIDDLDIDIARAESDDIE